MAVPNIETIRIYVLIIFFELLVVTCGGSPAQSFDDVILKSRGKRRVQCAEKFATITQGHTACLQRSSSLLDSGVSGHEKQLIVDEHNRLRRSVYPPAKNMRELSWDEELAKTAQRWADNCKIGHDERYKRYDYGRFDVGQNLCWSTYKMSWDEAMGLWSNETKDYRYGTNNLHAAIAHYTQIIWAETAHVGCGYSHCKESHLYVCNYGPAGNHDFTKPYEAGHSCGDCPYTCRDKLCDCRGKVCLNGGKMDLNTCTCTCNKEFTFYIAPYCDLNCTNIKDPDYCLEQFGPTTCEVYSNVPQMCPDMCRWCPAAGKNSRNTEYDQVTAHKDRIVEANTKHIHSRRKWETTSLATPNQNTNTRRQQTAIDAQHRESGGRFKDSDLQKVVGIVQESLTGRLEPLIHSHISGLKEDLEEKASDLEKRNNKLKMEVSGLSRKVANVSGTYFSLEKKARRLEKKNNKLLKEVGGLTNTINNLEDGLDSVEQRDRLNTLRISGIPKEFGDNTDEIVFQISTAIRARVNNSDIESSRRLGTAKERRTKDIIVKFSSYKAREKFYEARKLLKETDNYSSITINEYLTRKRKKLLVHAKKLVKGRRLKKAWSEDGTIFIENLKDKRRKISNEADLDKYKTKQIARQSSSRDAESKSSK